MTEYERVELEQDTALEDVYRELKRQDPDGSRWAKVIRHTYDMIYNGQETSRYRWDQLMKTEKTHFGTLFEINAQREFKFEGYDRDPTDYRIADQFVDAKWSQRNGGWMLPPEVFGHLALVATADDAKSQWSLGLVRISEIHRRTATNRDAKSQLSPAGRAAIRWLWKDAPLSPNVLLQLPAEEVANIFAQGGGTKRLDALFRAAEGMLIHRTTIATVAHQLDAQKRLRYSGGSRSSLAPEGFLILSGTYHKDLARDLGGPVPSTVEYIAHRVVPADAGNGTYIDGGWWRRARETDTITVPAPRIPEKRVPSTGS